MNNKELSLLSFLVRITTAMPNMNTYSLIVDAFPKKKSKEFKKAINIVKKEIIKAKSKKLMRNNANKLLSKKSEAACSVGEALNWALDNIGKK